MALAAGCEESGQLPAVDRWAQAASLSKIPCAALALFPQPSFLFSLFFHIK